MDLRRRCGRRPHRRSLRSGTCDSRWTCPTSRNSRTRRRSLPSPGTLRLPGGMDSSSGITSTSSERCRVPIADPWVLLAAVAQATERMKLGTAVTPMPRRRPWVLARQTATLDCLSSGRLILGVGLGFPAETEFTAFGEDPDIRSAPRSWTKASQSWRASGAARPSSSSGRHYHVARTRFLPTPVQRPRIPIWVAGTWLKEGPLRRAAAWDGYFPMKLGPGRRGGGADDTG